MGHGLLWDPTKSILSSTRTDRSPEYPPSIGIDTHFAIRVENFDEAVSDLMAKGFREDAAEDDPMRLIVSRNSVAGYPQAYLLDPDRHVIEFNAAADKQKQ